MEKLLLILKWDVPLITWAKGQLPMDRVFRGTGTSVFPEDTVSFLGQFWDRRALSLKTNLGREDTLCPNRSDCVLWEDTHCYLLGRQGLLGEPPDSYSVDMHSRQ